MRTLAVIAAACCAAGCLGPDAGTAAYLERAELTCVIARAPSFIVTKKDVVDLRQHFVPSPTWPQASRLALDIALSEWMDEEEVRRHPLPKRIRDYRAAVTTLMEAGGGGDALRNAFLEARKNAAVELGPCYVAEQER